MKTLLLSLLIFSTCAVFADQPDRFQIIAVHGAEMAGPFAVKIDKQTGKTWVLRNYILKGGRHALAWEELQDLKDIKEIDTPSN